MKIPQKIDKILKVKIKKIVRKLRHKSSLRLDNFQTMGYRNLKSGLLAIF